MPETLLRDLIELPDHVSRGDFVLSLDSGVRQAEATLGEYVVTPALAEHFNEALSVIKGALGSNKSRGTYLDGSFGSGKSHFMAVLNFLLAGEVKARAIPELARVVTSHDNWLQTKRFLMVPYHMIGAQSLESAVLGGYVRFVRERHPEATTPAVFRAQEWIRNAQQIREAVGDETFFATLNETGDDADAEWGELEGGWNAESFEAALEAGHRSEEYERLSGTLIDSYFPSIRKEGEYVSLDEGLAVISHHAKSLGYDALVLFLDEMILWLAGRASDVNFISSEVPKVSKLVESQHSDRAIPIVSFIARQRDLRELIGDHVMGAQSLNFADQLKYWVGRFGQIKLEDANLPFIAEKRVLKAKSPEARRQIDAEFERTTKVRETVMNVLLTKHSNREAFRKLYPFSPALVETLVAVSSLLQRERTALKIMLQLLVEQKHTMRLGELVPVGDLYDQIAQGDEAFSADMKRHFDTAHRLYRQQLRSILEDEQGLTFEEAAKLDFRDPKREALRNDDRLIKTLLLAALAPEVESLKNLTPERLSALNHGTIKSPIPGQEATIVLTKLRKWAGRCGQIKVPDGAGQPVVSIQLSGVDVEGILEKAMERDNFGNRIRTLKQKLFEHLSLQQNDSLWIEHTFRWRGTTRKCKISFQNVREAPLETFENDEDTWTLVIDYPVDRDGRSAQDDLARLSQYRDERPSARTLVWLPSMFSQSAQDQLGKLVRLEHILSENRFREFVEDLSPQDRESARSILQNMRDAQTVSLTSHLIVAYGLNYQDSLGSVDPLRKLEAEEHFQSLSSDLQLQVPGATQLGGAMQELLVQALGSQYPAHPEFVEDLRLTKGTVEKVLGVISDTLRNKERRLLVDKSERAIVKQIANPLRLGEMGETHFVIGEHWKDHFHRKAAQAGALDGMKVSQLREWIDAPGPMGLPALLQDLVILVFAQQTNRSFSLHGGAYSTRIDDLPRDCVLKEQALPEEAAWDRAVGLAQSALGVGGLPGFVSGQNVMIFSDRVKEVAVPMVKAAKGLEAILRDRARVFGCENTDEAPRLVAAREARKLVEAIQRHEGAKLVDALGTLNLESPPEAVAQSLKCAEPLTELLARADLRAIHAAAELEGIRGDRGRQYRDALFDAFCHHEYAVPFEATYQEAHRQCIDLMAEALREQKREVLPATPQVVPLPAIPVTRQGSKQTRSNVSGDHLPEGFERDHAAWLLVDVSVTAENGPVMIAVSRNLEALIRADDAARIDKASGVLVLPRFNWNGKVNVEGESLDS